MLLSCNLFVRSVGLGEMCFLLVKIKRKLKRKIRVDNAMWKRRNNVMILIHLSIRVN